MSPRTKEQLTPTRTPLSKTKTLPTKTKTPVQNSKTKTKQKQNDTITKSIITTKPKTTHTTNYAHNPNYEYDPYVKRWVKKSDVRPIELVRRHQDFLIDYLKNNSKLDPKEIEKIVRKHSTSEKRLLEILVQKGAMTHKKATAFLSRNNFFQKELCKYMKTICPTETCLLGRDWCYYSEDAFFYYKDKETNKVSCYTLTDILEVISSSFTGGGEDAIFLQLPRDPYTRKVLSQDFIKAFLKQLRYVWEYKDLGYPHVVYFLRHYKKFYSDPNIKPYLEKKNLTSQEKWQLSEGIEEFLMDTDEIFNDWAEGHKRWWFWYDDKRPNNKFDYIFPQRNTPKTKKKTMKTK